MKVCITSQGSGLTSQVDSRFGRAAIFILVDTDTGDLKAIGNEQNLQAVQGAGIQAAQKVAAAGANAVITGHCGPKAFRVLRAAGIQVFTVVQGTVAEAIEDFKAKKLTAMESPDVEGHWG